MNRLFLLFLLNLIWLFPGIAQQEIPDSYAPTAEENALLWRISGRGMEAPSYLFGTIHMISKEDFFLTGPTRTHFGETERVAFEIDLEEMNDMGAMLPLMMQAFMRGDTSLQDLLPEEDYSLVKTHFEKMGLPMMFLDRIKPMFLSALSSEDLFTASQEPGQVVSYEMEFMKLANEQQKEIAGLETAEFQMSVFDSIPYGVQAQMLVESIREGDSGDEQLQKLVELYKKEDLQGLQEMLHSDEGGIGQYEDVLLLRRNRNWVPVMEKMMREKPTFFAVGAGHLAGEAGVIALLRANGYTVEPIR